MHRLFNAASFGNSTHESTFGPCASCALFFRSPTNPLELLDRSRCNSVRGWPAVRVSSIKIVGHAMTKIVKGRGRNISGHQATTSSECAAPQWKAIQRKGIVDIVISAGYPSA
jgi:hypothetical protein